MLDIMFDWTECLRGENVPAQQQATKPRRRKPMSLVLATRVEGNSILFASDKRVSKQDEHGFIITTHNEAVKLIPAFGGMIGWVGDPNLAVQLLRDAAAGMSAGASENEISRRLADAYANRVAIVAKVKGGLDKAQEFLNEDVKYIYGVCAPNGCRLTTFYLKQLFVPHTEYDTVNYPEQVATLLYDQVAAVTSIGMDRHVISLQQWLKKPTYTLRDAIRLSLIILHFANELEPTSVGKNIDMFLLKAGGLVEKVDFASEQDWVDDFIMRTRNEFFKP